MFLRCLSRKARERCARARKGRGSLVLEARVVFDAAEDLVYFFDGVLLVFESLLQVDAALVGEGRARLAREAAGVRERVDVAARPLQVGGRLLEELEVDAAVRAPRDRVVERLHAHAPVVRLDAGDRVAVRRLLRQRVLRLVPRQVPLRVRAHQGVLLRVLRQDHSE